MEIILREHYLRLFVFRIKPVFILQRIALYFVYQTVIYGMISNRWYCFKMRKIVGSLKDIYELILKVDHNLL